MRLKCARVIQPVPFSSGGNGYRDYMRDCRRARLLAAQIILWAFLPHAQSSEIAGFQIAVLQIAVLQIDALTYRQVS